MAHYQDDYSYIYVNSSYGLSIEEIKNCLKENTRDLGSLCVSDKVAPFAKRKPEYHQAYVLDDTLRAQNSFSFRIKNGSTWTDDSVFAGINISGNAPTWMNKKLFYRKPDGGAHPYRQLDFDGYWRPSNEYLFHTTQKGGSTIAANVMDNNDSHYICFYGFFKNMGTYFSNKPFSTTNGINTGGTLIPNANYISRRCLCLENFLEPDITEQYPDDVSISGGYFGVYIIKDNQNKTKVDFYKCWKAFDAYSTNETEMYKLPLIGPHGLIDPDRRDPSGPTTVGGLDDVSEDPTPSDAVSNVPSGTYIAVPLLLYNNKYYPAFVYNTTATEVQNNSGYGANFKVVLGGQEMYWYETVGASKNASDPQIQTNFDTSAETVLVHVDIWNVTYTNNTSISQSRLSKFSLKVHTSGTVIPRDITDPDYPGGVTINVPDQILSMTSPTSGFTINVNGTHTRLTFTTQNVWKTGRSTEPVVGDNSRVTLSCVLRYDGIQIGGDSAVTPGNLISLRFILGA